MFLANGAYLEKHDIERFRVWHMNVSAAYYAKASKVEVEKKLDLSDVTLICADGIHIEYAIPAIERCKALCNFGAVKLLTSMPTDYPHRVEIEPLTSLSAYSVFMISRIHEYVDTSHMLVVQHDGWILNPDIWDPAWMELDYIGPLFIHKHQTGSSSVGSGGFSFRSRRLMASIASRISRWDGTEESTDRLMKEVGCYEDGAIAWNYRPVVEREGCRFATPEQASRFAQGGNNDPAYHVEKPFGFHGLWENINFETGLVRPPPFGC